MSDGGEKKRRVSMDAGYSVLSNDLEACRMFDQYSYKVEEEMQESLDLGSRPRKQETRSQYIPSALCYIQNAIRSKLICILRGLHNSHYDSVYLT
ncbi:PREDICTED: uncharacterized protein LOC105448168 isoform X2 [Wasmannia auropunctata]|uniref:uncharacterized protein LOC105448168 isoform X2 n=1 Tax=Wasmannia auropunctata TaxID=64793 RepID=UPI0005F08472|nr:PREDICTED: uncharacterized protein LOC105448168 isoform X2 [Wasmannia auropunctata]